VCAALDIGEPTVTRFLAATAAESKCKQVQVADVPAAAVPAAGEGAVVRRHRPVPLGELAGEGPLRGRLEFTLAGERIPCRTNSSR
jgi:hypothetical protein